MQRILTLAAALRASSGLRMALVGAGGKTSAMMMLARELPPPVIVTASTHLGAWQTGFADRYFTITDSTHIDNFSGTIEGVTLFTGAAAGDQRLSGLDAASLDALDALAARIRTPLILEADGSRQRPLKAPSAHEPVIPTWVSQVVVVAGLSGLGRRLEPSGEAVHRPEIYAQLAGVEMGSVIGPEELVRVLLHPQGGLKGIPPGASRAVLLNQVDDSLRSKAFSMVEPLLRAYDRVIISELAQPSVIAACQPLAGVILAAGESRRLGQPKTLLPLRGKALIRHAAENALAGGLQQVVVVTGAVDAPIREALDGLPVRIIHNHEWQSGQSTTVRAGLRAAREGAPRELGGAVFLLGDQPFAGAALLRALRDHHRHTMAPVIAPSVRGRRANPVLFDQVTFSALEALTGDTGGRAIFDRFPPELLDWPDDRLLIDVDTLEDYQHLLAVDGGSGA